MMIGLILLITEIANICKMRRMDVALLQWIILWTLEQGMPGWCESSQVAW